MARINSNEVTLQQLIDTWQSGAIPWDNATLMIELLLQRHKQSEGMREAFRKAASDMAIEAGVISAPVKHDEVAGSVLQDVYFLQLLAESQLYMQRLSVRYEKLRAAAIPVADAMTCSPVSIAAIQNLREVLRDET
jgi:hypothetical protein